MSVSLDRAGVAASSLCALHCGACALLPGLLAALGLSEILGHEAEWLFVAAALGFAFIALVSGLRRHGDKAAAGSLLLGMALLLMARAVETLDIHGFELALGGVAACFLVTGHVMNIRAARCCETGCVTD